MVLGLGVLAQLLARIGRGDLAGCFHQNLVIIKFLKGFLLNMNTGGGVGKSRLSSHTAGVLGQLN